MARPGPPKKPTALKLIAGNPGKKALPKDEPKPRVEIPDPPKHLTPVALEEWNRITPILAKLGLVSQLDRAALASYCQWWSRHVEAEEQLNKQRKCRICKGSGTWVIDGRGPEPCLSCEGTGVVAGPVSAAPSGYPMPSPWFSITKQCSEMMNRLIQEFGLTPAARARISAKPPEDDGAAKKKFSF